MGKAKTSINKTALDVLKTTKKAGGTPVQVGPVRARASRSRSRTPARLQPSVESSSGVGESPVKRGRGRPKSSPKIPSTPAQKASTQAKKPAKKKETKPKSRPAKATKRVGKTPTAAKKERTTPSRSTAAKAERKSTPSAPASARKSAATRSKGSSAASNSNLDGSTRRYATRAKVSIIENNDSSQMKGSNSNVSVSSRGSASEGGGWFSRCVIV